MNPQFVSDIMTSLRWTAFPNNAKEMLAKVEHFYISCKANAMIWKPDIFRDLVNQFIYNVVDVRDCKRTQLTAIQQLQLADIIIGYLSYPRSEADREAVFNSIFYSYNFQKGDVPLRILGLVSSLAVAFRKYEVLQCIAIWMLTATSTGAENPAVLSIAVDLSRDFVTDEFSEKYDYLPQKAYLFTAMFLIAIGKAYKTTQPPQRLLEQVTTWIESSPRVCFVAPQSAVFDLFRWCTHSIHPAQDEAKNESRLHLALLSAIERAGKGVQLQVIPHIMTLIHELRVKREHVIATSTNNGGGGVPSLERSSMQDVERGLDMLFQLIQILIATECLDRNEIHPIFETTEQALLPQTELYEQMRSIYYR